MISKRFATILGICFLWLWCSTQLIYPETKFHKIELVGLSEKSDFKAQCNYSLRRKQQVYIGQFSIRSQNKILWIHDWQMSDDDFQNILQNEPTIKEKNLSSWVNNVFQCHYGVKVLIHKISKDDLDEAIINIEAKNNRIPPEKIIEEIVSDDSPLVIFYRAEWREDLICIVFLKSLGKFIYYSRGYTKY